MTMDISDTLAPASDQLDAIELVSGPRTFVIESVSKGEPDQPVQVHLVGFPRPWRPGKSMRRVLASCWGANASEWVGRRVTLFFDPDVMFGKERPGGTRISHLSDLPDGRRATVPLLISRGKSAMYTVEPLPDAPAAVEPSIDDVAACTDEPTLLDWWHGSGIERKAQIQARVQELRDKEADR